MVVEDGGAYLAVDLGAGSGRVMLGRFSEGALHLDELHRFAQPVTRSGGHERWQIEEIFHQVEVGLQEAGRQEVTDPATIRSVGVDGWGVDYGLLDSRGALIEDPVCYRDPRTDGVLDEFLRRMSGPEVYDRTGIQFLPFNTAVQLLAQTTAGEWPENAHSLLMIPDLVHRHLSGIATGEFTNATTTQLLDARTGGWCEDLLRVVGVQRDVMPPVVPPGTNLGPLLVEHKERTGLRGLHVVVPASHDTGSAVAGTALREGCAYLSSGTWSLLGVETGGPVLTEIAERHNFTNEGGVYGTNRLLKNVMGLWLLESCRQVWDGEGCFLGHERLAAELTDEVPGRVFMQPDAPRFLHPKNMVQEIREHLADTGQKIPDAPLELARVILESLALRYAVVVELLEEITGDAVEAIHVVGGGSRNDFLNQATASATGRPVHAGPVEATAIGNLLVQAICDGVFPDLATGRQFLSRVLPLRTFSPRAPDAWREARRRFDQL